MEGIRKSLGCWSPLTSLLPPGACDSQLQGCLLSLLSYVLSPNHNSHCWDVFLSVLFLKHEFSYLEEILELGYDSWRVHAVVILTIKHSWSGWEEQCAKHEHPCNYICAEELQFVNVKYVTELKAGENPSTHIYVNQSPGFWSTPL